MKNTLYIIFLTISSIACSQNLEWHKVNIDSSRSYEIKNEGNVINTLFDVPETEGVIKSSLIVNNDTLNKIQFVKGELNNDTLRILIHQTDPAYHHEYEITVFGDEYRINYEFRTSGEQDELKWMIIDSMLKLNSLDFKSGKEIRGYTEYEGKCVAGCNSDPERITVKGNFSVLIE